MVCLITFLTLYSTLALSDPFSFELGITGKTLVYQEPDTSSTTLGQYSAGDIVRAAAVAIENGQAIPYDSNRHTPEQLLPPVTRPGGRGAVAGPNGTIIRQTTNGWLAIQMQDGRVGYIGTARTTTALPKTDPDKKPIKRVTPLTQKELSEPASMPPSVRIKSVQQGLEDFHQGLCPLISHESRFIQFARTHSRLSDSQMSRMNRRDRMKWLWKYYVDSRTSRAEKNIAIAAMQSDVLTRTLMFESHQPGQLPGLHPARGACERQVISYSIYNRARDCKKRRELQGPSRHKWGCNKGHDPVVDVATEPAEINIWFEKFEHKTHIHSCFLRDTNQEYFKSDGRAFTEKEIAIYKKWQAEYPVALVPAMKVLGFTTSENSPKLHRVHRDETARLLSLFRFSAIRTNTNSVGVKEDSGYVQTPISELQEYLTDRFFTYYHPKHMRSCNPRDFARLRYARFAHPFCGTKPLYLVRDRIKLTDMSGNEINAVEPINKTAVYQVAEVNGRPYRCEDGSSPTLKGVFEPEISESYTCLPEGVLPACIGKRDSAGKTLFPGGLNDYLNSRIGFRYSNNLLSHADRNDMLDLQRQSNRLRQGDRFTPFMNQRALRRNKNIDKLLVGIQCKDPDLKENAQSPQFAGMCDLRIIPQIEVPRGQFDFSYDTIVSSQSNRLTK